MAEACLGRTETEQQPALLTPGLGSSTAPREQRALVYCLGLLCFLDHFAWRPHGCSRPSREAGWAAVTSTFCREETKATGADLDTLGLAQDALPPGAPGVLASPFLRLCAQLPQDPHAQLLGVWGRMCSLKSFLYLCIFSDYKINRYSWLKHIKELTTQKCLRTKSSSPQRFWSPHPSHACVQFGQVLILLGFFLLTYRCVIVL